MALNFEDIQKDGNTFLNRACHFLGIQNRDQAGRILRSVLHAIRDRIPPEEAVHLAAQLPLAWKGVYFDGFTIQGELPRIRDKKDWLEFIRSKNQMAAQNDFPTLELTEYAFQDIMDFLRESVSEGQFNHVVQALHAEISDLVEA
jgi:uncharacterized protein (DUF2267 family)